MNLLSEAKRYTHELKYSVIPVNISYEDGKYIKKPTVAWKEYQDRIATDEELEKWFANSYNNGIGIITGKISGIVVVDVEKEGLLETVKTLNIKEGNRYAETISGGRHYYYRYEPLKNAVKVDGLNFDIRGDGGFVVAPPTEYNGQSYKWLYELENMFLKNVPSEVKSKLGGNGWIESGHLKTTIQDKVNVSEGSRNDSLNRLACSLLHRESPETVWEVINNINRTYNPPLDESEVNTIFNSAKRFIDAEKIRKENGYEEKINNFLIGEPVQWVDIKAKDFSERWLWEGFIAKGNITLFTAIMKAGKSTFLRGLFSSMSKNEEVAGQPTTKCNILVISEESDDVWSESKKFIEEKEINHVSVWIRPIRGKPNYKEWDMVIKQIAEVCEKKKIELLVIDTLSSFWPIDDENDSAKVNKALTPLYTFTQKGIAVLLIHHDRKGGGDHGEAVRGSSALAGFADQLVHFKRNENGLPNQRIITTNGRLTSTKLIIALEYSISDEKYTTLGEPWKISKKARLEKIMDIFKRENRPLTSSAVSSLWSIEVEEISERSIRRYINELEKDGLLKVKEGSNERRPEYVATGWLFS